MHYYQFNISDFALHAGHLTLEEEGIYRRLLDFYYDTEKPIPKETQLVVRRLRLGSSIDLFNSILDEFFTLEEDGWHNYRCDIEIKAYKSKAECARKNGRKGGRPPKNKGEETQSVNLDNPEKTGSKANQELLTNNHKPLTKVNKAFTKPPLQDVQALFHELGSMTCLDDGERFYDHYSANGWKVGKNSMKDWKATVRNWHKRNKDKQNEKNQQSGLTKAPVITLRDSNF